VDDAKESTEMFNSLILPVCLLFAAQVAVVDQSTLRPPGIAVRMYLEDTTIRIGDSLSLVASITNRGAVDTQVWSFVNVRYVATKPDGSRVVITNGGEVSPIRPHPQTSDDPAEKNHQGHVLIQVTVEGAFHEEQIELAEYYFGFSSAAVTTLNLEPARSLFLQATIPSWMLLDDTCKVTTSILMDGREISRTPTRTITVQHPTSQP
jgi:hypothetical protein